MSEPKPSKSLRPPAGPPKAKEAPAETPVNGHAADASPAPPAPPADAGELTVGEMRLIEQLRAAANQIVLEIGNMEVRKSQLLARLGQLEAQGQAVLNTAARRLNIPDGETWHVTNEGKVRRGVAPPA